MFARHLAEQRRPVLAIDADINQHLAAALGGPESAATATPLGEHLSLMKDYLRGDNPLLGSAAEMVKTTPPGSGSRLLRVVEDNPIGDRRVHRRGPRRRLLPLEGRSGRTAAQPHARPSGRVRGGGHDRRRRLVRVGAVHPLRPHLPDLRTDRAQRRRLPPVRRVRPRLRGGAVRRR
ncbi:hypothetical protein [Micromonospora sp. NPDC126480]|uniref:hypothetical protein n=1 Tax=Micromonospora sp. NPDC126480 TaxID=3155312 RepID=UPI003327238F